MRKSFAIVVVALFMLPIMSCQGFFSAPVLTSITISPSSPSVQVNGTLQLSATGLNDDGSTATLNSVTWDSSDKTKATISSTGLVSGIAAGSSTITATSGNVSGTATLNVGTSTSLIVTPSDSTVISSTTSQVQFTAMSGTSNVTQDAQWSSNPTGIVTFSTTTPGQATIVGTGKTTITATVTASGLSGSTTLTVQ